MTDDKYPAWRFHPDQPARIVQNEEEDKSLGKGWLDSHLKLPKPKDDAETPAAPTDLPAPEPTSEPMPEASPRPRRK